MSDRLKFFCDVHIAREAVRQLQNKGVDIIHSGEVALSDAEDKELLVYAIDNDRVMVSCDDDFIRLHNQYQQEQQKHIGIVYFRMNDQCKSISVIVNEIMFLYEAAEYQTDLYNQVWRVST